MISVVLCCIMSCQILVHRTDISDRKTTTDNDTNTQTNRHKKTDKQTDKQTKTQTKKDIPAWQNVPPWL